MSKSVPESYVIDTTGEKPVYKKRKIELPPLTRQPSEPHRAPVRGDTGKLIAGVVNPDALPEAWEIDCARDGGAATAKIAAYFNGELIKYCVAVNPGRAMLIVVRNRGKVVVKDGSIVTEVITGQVEIREKVV